MVTKWNVKEKQIQCERSWSLSTSGPRLKKLRFRVPATASLTPELATTNLQVTINDRNVPFQVAEIQQIEPPQAVEQESNREASETAFGGESG